MDLPVEASRPSFVAVLDDRICAIAADGLMTVVVADGQRHSTLQKKACKTHQEIQSSNGDIKVKTTISLGMKWQLLTQSRALVRL